MDKMMSTVVLCVALKYVNGWVAQSGDGVPLITIGNGE